MADIENRWLSMTNYVNTHGSAGIPCIAELACSAPVHRISQLLKFFLDRLGRHLVDWWHLN